MRTAQDRRTIVGNAELTDAVNLLECDTMNGNPTEDEPRPPRVRRPYSPPVILSREPLEAVAVVCTTGGPVPGKMTPPPGPCAALRS